MQIITLIDPQGVHWKRVDKRTARRCYELSKPVILCPHKMQPFGIWQCGVAVSKLDDDSCSFDKHCIYATVYNCVDKQTGLYLSYYVKE